MVAVITWRLVVTSYFLVASGCPFKQNVKYQRLLHTLKCPENASWMIDIPFFANFHKVLSHLSTPKHT